MEYLESMSNNEQFMFNQDGLNQLLGGMQDEALLKQQAEEDAVSITNH